MVFDDVKVREDLGEVEVVVWFDYDDVVVVILGYGVG